MRALILRMDAPLVSFGAPVIDQMGVIQHFPALSMLTGMAANALGWDRRETAKLQALQDRIRFAGRTDRRGEALVDYQIVDLGKPWMLSSQAGWTTRGRIAERGGASDEGLHIRYRHYRADSVHTVALSLDGDDEPDLDAVARAFDEPARPLFLGRKCCLPAGRILVGVVDCSSLLSALAEYPRDQRSDSGPLPAWWWTGDDGTRAVGETRVVPVTDERDWANQIHVGRRFMREGRIDPPEAPHG